MSVKTVGSGLKTRLETISGLKVFAPHELRDSYSYPVFAIIVHMGTDYDITGGGNNSTDLHHFKILLGITRADTPSALSKLLDYTAKTGTKSIRAAILGDVTLGGVAQSIPNVNNTGQNGFRWGGQVYLGTTFEDIQVYE